MSSKIKSEKQRLLKQKPDCNLKKENSSIKGKKKSTMCINSHISTKNRRKRGDSSSKKTKRKNARETRSTYTPDTSKNLPSSDKVSDSDLVIISEADSCVSEKVSTENDLLSNSNVLDLNEDKLSSIKSMDYINDLYPSLISNQHISHSSKCNIATVSDQNSLSITEKVKFTNFEATLPDTEVNNLIFDKTLDSVERSKLNTSCIIDRTTVMNNTEQMVTNDVSNTMCDLTNPKKTFMLLMNRLNSLVDSKEDLICNKLKMEPVIKPPEFNYELHNAFQIAVDLPMLKAANDYIKENASECLLEIPDADFENNWENSLVKTSDLPMDFLNLSDINNISSEEAESEISIISCKTADIEPEFFLDISEHQISSGSKDEGSSKVPQKANRKRKKSMWYPRSNKRKCKKNNNNVPKLDNLQNEESLCDTCEEESDVEDLTPDLYSDKCLTLVEKFEDLGKNTELNAISSVSGGDTTDKVSLKVKNRKKEKGLRHKSEDSILKFDKELNDENFSNTCNKSELGETFLDSCLLKDFTNVGKNKNVKSISESCAASSVFEIDPVKTGQLKNVKHKRENPKRVKKNLCHEENKHDNVPELINEILVNEESSCNTHEENELEELITDSSFSKHISNAENYKDKDSDSCASSSACVIDLNYSGQLKNVKQKRKKSNNAKKMRKNKNSWTEIQFNKETLLCEQICDSEELIKDDSHRKGEKNASDSFCQNDIAEKNTNNKNSSLQVHCSDPVVFSQNINCSVHSGRKKKNDNSSIKNIKCSIDLNILSDNLNDDIQFSENKIGGIHGNIEINSDIECNSSLNSENCVQLDYPKKTQETEIAEEQSNGILKCKKLIVKLQRLDELTLSKYCKSFNTRKNEKKIVSLENASDSPYSYQNFNDHSEHLTNVDCNSVITKNNSPSHTKKKNSSPIILEKNSKHVSKNCICNSGGLISKCNCPVQKSPIKLSPQKIINEASTSAKMCESPSSVLSGLCPSHISKVKDDHISDIQSNNADNDLNLNTIDECSQNLNSGSTNFPTTKTFSPNKKKILKPSEKASADQSSSLDMRYDLNDLNQNYNNKILNPVKISKNICIETNKEISSYASVSDVSSQDSANSNFKMSPPSEFSVKSKTTEKSSKVQKRSARMKSSSNLQSEECANTLTSVVAKACVETMKSKTCSPSSCSTSGKTEITCTKINKLSAEVKVAADDNGNSVNINLKKKHKIASTKCRKLNISPEKNNILPEVDSQNLESVTAESYSLPKSKKNKGISVTKSFNFETVVPRENNLENQVKNINSYTSQTLPKDLEVPLSSISLVAKSESSVKSAKNKVTKSPVVICIKRNVCSIVSENKSRGTETSKTVLSKKPTSKKTKRILQSKPVLEKLHVMSNDRNISMNGVNVALLSQNSDCLMSPRILPEPETIKQNEQNVKSMTIIKDSLNLEASDISEKINKGNSVIEETFIVKPSKYRELQGDVESQNTNQNEETNSSEKDFTISNLQDDSSNKIENIPMHFDKSLEITRDDASSSTEVIVSLPESKNIHKSSEAECNSEMSWNICQIPHSGNIAVQKQSNKKISKCSARNKKTNIPKVNTSKCTKSYEVSVKDSKNENSKDIKSKNSEKKNVKTKSSKAENKAKSKKSLPDSSIKDSEILNNNISEDFDSSTIDSDLNKERISTEIFQKSNSTNLCSFQEVVTVSNLQDDISSKIENIPMHFDKSLEITRDDASSSTEVTVSLPESKNIHSSSETECNSEMSWNICQIPNSDNIAIQKQSNKEISKSSVRNKKTKMPKVNTSKCTKSYEVSVKDSKNENSKDFKSKNSEKENVKAKSSKTENRAKSKEPLPDSNKKDSEILSNDISENFGSTIDSDLNKESISTEIFQKNLCSFEKDVIIQNLRDDSPYKVENILTHKKISKVNVNQNQQLQEEFTAQTDPHVDISTNSSSLSPKISHFETKPDSDAVMILMDEDLDFEPDQVDDLKTENSIFFSKSSNSIIPQGDLCPKFVLKSSTKQLDTDLNKTAESYLHASTNNIDYESGEGPNDKTPFGYFFNNIRTCPPKTDLPSEDDSDSDDEHSFKRSREIRKNVSMQNNDSCLYSNDSKCSQNESQKVVPRACNFSEDVCLSKSGVSSNKCLNTKVSTGHHLSDVIARIEEYCSRKLFMEAMQVARTYIAISTSSDIYKVYIKKLLKGLFSSIFHSNNKHFTDFKVFEEVLKLMHDFNLYDTQISSFFITKCCIHSDLTPDSKLSIYSIQMFNICICKRIHLNIEALNTYSLLLKSEDVSLPVLLDYLHFVKSVCNKSVPKDLIHLALKKSKTCKFSDIHDLCLFLHHVSFKEIDENDLTDFLQFCFKKGMWPYVAEMLMAWSKSRLLICIFKALRTDEENMGKYFSKFAKALHGQDQSLHGELKLQLSQIGATMLMTSFSKNLMNCTLEILNTLHTYNVNYFEDLFESSLDANYLRTLPFFSVFNAIDVCLDKNFPRNAFVIFQEYSWINCMKDLNDAEKAYVLKEKYHHLLKLIPLLCKKNSLNEGWEALKIFLSEVEQDILQVTLEGNKAELFSIYNKYLVKLLNCGKISSAHDLYQHSLGPKKDIFVLKPDVLRGLVVAFSQHGKSEIAYSLFMFGIMKKIYSIKKPEPESFPWDINILSIWTTTEIKFAIEWFIGTLFPLLMDKPKETNFEKWFSVKINFIVVNQNSVKNKIKINCLLETESDPKEKTKEVLNNMDPSLQFSDETHDGALYITSSSLYSYWRSKCPDTSLKFPPSDTPLLLSKKKKLLFGSKIIPLAEEETAAPLSSDDKNLNEFQSPKKQLQTSAESFVSEMRTNASTHSPVSPKYSPSLKLPNVVNNSSKTCIRLGNEVSPFGNKVIDNSPLDLPNIIIQTSNPNPLTFVNSHQECYKSPKKSDALNDSTLTCVDKHTKFNAQNSGVMLVQSSDSKNNVNTTCFAASNNMKEKNAGTQATNVSKTSPKIPVTYTSVTKTPCSSNSTQDIKVTLKNKQGQKLQRSSSLLNINRQFKVTRLNSSSLKFGSIGKKKFPVSTPKSLACTIKNIRGRNINTFTNFTVCVPNNSDVRTVLNSTPSVSHRTSLTNQNDVIIKKNINKDKGSNIAHFQCKIPISDTKMPLESAKSHVQKQNQELKDSITSSQNVPTVTASCRQSSDLLPKRNIQTKMLKTSSQTVVSNISGVTNTQHQDIKSNQAKPFRPVIKRNFVSNVNKSFISSTDKLKTVSERAVASSTGANHSQVMFDRKEQRNEPHKVETKKIPIQNVKVTNLFSGTCDEEGFKEIFEFLGRKVALKHKNVSQEYQQAEAERLANLFVTNYKVTILDKKTKKNLSDFAKCYI